MTVKMLTAWNGYPKDYIGSVISPSEEARLVGIGFASYDLDGVDNDNVRTPVTATTNPLTGGIELSAGGESVFKIDNRPKYPAFFTKQPLTSTIIPFGSVAISEIVVTGGSGTGVVDSATTFNSSPTTKVSITAPSSGANISAGVSSASIMLGEDGAALLERKPLIAVKLGVGNTLVSGTLYVGSADYSSFYTFGMELVGKVGEWSILSRERVGATSTTGVPDLTANVRAKLKLEFAANVAIGDLWLSPLYVAPQATPSVVFTVDDGFAEWSWLADQAKMRGVPISFGVSKAFVGAGGYLTSTQVTALAKNYDGLHEVTNHANTNDNYFSLGSAAYLADVEACRDYLIGLGVPYKSASLHQYVQGQYDQALINELKLRGFTSAREVGASNRSALNLEISIIGSSADALYKLPASCSLDVATSLTTAKQYIANNAFTGTPVIMGHKFSTVAGANQWVKGYDATHGVLNLLDWLAEQRDVNGWKLLKWSDWVDQQLTSQMPPLLS